MVMIADVLSARTNLDMMGKFIFLVFGVVVYVYCVSRILQ